jgi:hypothetical protein
MLPPIVLMRGHVITTVIIQPALQQVYSKKASGYSLKID